jgi:hypothetical protein
MLTQTLNASHTSLSGATAREERPIQDLDEFTVTEAALAQMAATPDKRLKEIMDAAVRHLHAFGREVNLTPEEWLTGIESRCDRAEFRSSSLKR